MEFRVLRENDVSTFEHLFVKGTDVRAGLRGHEPQVGCQSVEVRGEELFLELPAEAVRAETHPWLSGQVFALCIVCSGKFGRY